MRRKSILIIIALMAIGFAAITTGILINGSTTISENQTEFEIVFTRGLLDEEDKSSEIISQDKKTITFTSKDLKDVGDKSVLIYDVTNLSNIYDASVSVDVTVEENNYLRVTNEFDEENNLGSKQTRTGVLKIELIKAATTQKEFSVTLELHFDAVDRNEIGTGDLPDNEIESITFYNSNNEPLVNQSISIGSNNYTTDSNGKIYPTTLNPYQKYDVMVFSGKCNVYLANLTNCNGVFANVKMKQKNGVVVATKNYDFTGKEEEYVVPLTGIYRLETWGAQGGTVDSGSTGGYGGYSIGEVNLTTGDRIYINVGGAGSTTCSGEVAGGYNGGGVGSGRNCSNYTGDYYRRCAGSGGGASSVATKSGTLPTFSEELDKDKILIVAGGGGGGLNMTNYIYGKGGHGGGYVGVQSWHNNPGQTVPQYAEGGSQTSGGLYGNSYQDRDTIDNAASFKLYYSGRFGQGGSGANYECGDGGGGGGGFYGGGGSLQTGGGGGSSYIGNYLLTDKRSYCYNCTEDLTNTATFTVKTNGESSYRNTTECGSGYSSSPISGCAKAGHGYARITYLGNGYKVYFNPNGGTVAETKRIVLKGSSLGELPVPTRGTDTFDGWYYDENFNQRIDSTYKPLGNITLYAKYITE